MAYTSGSAANIIALIDAIRAFAITDSWTNNLYADDGTGKRLHLQKNGIFANFRACNNENPWNNPLRLDVESANNLYGLWLNLSTAFDSGDDWYKQAGAPYYVSGANNVREYAGINALNTAVNYHLFSFDNALYVVVENPAGVFHWLGCGNLSPKFGDWTGGEFWFGKQVPAESGNTSKTFPIFGSAFAGQGNGRGYVRVNDIDSLSGWVKARADTISGTFRAERSFSNIQRSRNLWELTPNLISGKPVLLPYTVWMTRNGATVDNSQPISYLGEMENLYFINISGLIPAAEYADGTGALFRVFPYHQKQDELAWSSPNFSTGTLGFAIRSN